MVAMASRLFGIRGWLVAGRRVLTLLIAGGVGWVLASQCLSAQEPSPPWFMGETSLTGDWLASPPHAGPICHGQALADGPVGLAFWAPPTVSTPPARSTATVVTKIPFRYGDFGATSYPIRHVTHGYYRSRTDWVWQ